MRRNDVVFIVSFAMSATAVWAVSWAVGGMTNAEFVIALLGVLSLSGAMPLLIMGLRSSPSALSEESPALDERPSREP